MSGETFEIPGNVSSQYVTGLLAALPLLPGSSTLRVTGNVESAAYIAMTEQVLRMAGIRFEKVGWGYSISGGQMYDLPEHVEVEGDWSNAAFLLALGEGVTVTGLRAESLQGDRVCRDMLRRLQSPGAQLDLTACPDLGPVLFAAAARAHGAVFTGTRRLRIKESDRVAAMAQELAKLGVRVDAEENRVTVHPGGIAAPREVLDGHNDHRIVMALSVLATSVGGTIRGAEAVAKSYPDFFEVLQALGIRAEIRP